jgi:ketosteroid isomerase-like protein
MSNLAGIARKMIDSYCAMDADKLLPLLHADAKHSAPGSDFGADLEGAGKIAEYFRKDVFPAFHKVRFEVVHLYEDEKASTVVAEWRSHLNPKSGRDYSNTGVFIIEIRDSKIYWVREYFDTEKAHQNV